MPHRKNIYYKQKLRLYFDENFPNNTINVLKRNNSFKKLAKIYSVFDFNNENKDDKYQLNFCKNKGFILVTLDKDFMDDLKYPISKIPGILRIIAGKKSDTKKIIFCLKSFVHFISAFPIPRNFVGDAKFQVSSEGCVLRGRHMRTREIITVIIQRGDTVSKVINKFL